MSHEQMRNECNILLEHSEEGRPFGKPRYPGGRTIKRNMPETALNAVV